jgi:TPR repeat protein
MNRNSNPMRRSVTKRSFWGIDALAAAIFAIAIAAFGVADPASAQTRRAFLLGEQRYSDQDIPSLTRSDNDASDLAADLEQVGFDKKNITLATELRGKADFDKRFNTFLATVKEGDTVLFFYSGHGLGVEANNTNYLLLGDIKSLRTYTRGQVIEADRRQDELISLKMPAFEGAYETDEIAKNGISVTDVMNEIAGKKPKVTILFLDACRSIIRATTDEREIKRGVSSGSRLLPTKDLPAGSIVTFSASFGETAIESFGYGDHRRNSLFTEVLRSELQRPGQTLIDLSQRVSRMVRAFALAGGRQQEPEYFENLGVSDDFMLVDSIGAQRFQLTQQQCAGADVDWAEISQQPEREALERHRRRFHDCPTAELARRALVSLIGSAEVATPVLPAGSKQIDDCDRLAASDSDPARPPEVPGVGLDKIDFDAATTACEKSIQHNSRIVRFLFNLGRAKFAAANAVRLDDPARKPLIADARAAYNDAANRGYVAALYSLATLSDYTDADEDEQARANELLMKAANQEFPLAMYELGRRYSKGSFGLQRDLAEAYRWMSKAAEGGSVPAMVETAEALFYGQGVAQNPRRAVEWAQRAADSGSDVAKFNLGWYYFRGFRVYNNAGDLASSSLLPDDTQALLWWGRAAAENNPAAQYWMAGMMERGYGLPSPQPEIAERYYRLAAHGGNEDAEIELSRRLIAGRMLVKPENGSNEAIDLLNRALSHGSARAANMLVEIYRNGELDQPKDPVLAMKYAFLAIKLSVQADPAKEDGNPFYEINAGISLAEMAVNGQAVDVNDRALLNPDEIDRLQRFYGTVDPATHKVKIRRLDVPLGGCNSFRKSVWVWDWGRAESPTEPQFRSLERETYCYDNDILRRTLSASYDAARKAKVPFADLINQQIIAAQAQENAPAARQNRR